MVKKHSILYFLLFMAAGCDVFNFDEEAPIYPTQLDKLEMDELVSLNEKFQSANDKICSTLNEYGLTGYSTVLFEGESGPCSNREPVRIELTEPDTLLLHAAETVVLNSEYTGVSDIEDLSLKEMEPLRGCIICEGPETDSRILEWKFIFQEQEINGIKVYDSTITVIVDANGVNRIWGNWYSEPYIPARANVLPDEIVENLDGQTIIWDEDGEEYRYTIEADGLILPDQKTVIAFENEDLDKLELRVGWKFEIKDQHVPFGGWTVIADMVDGRILKVDKALKSNDFGPIYGRG
jgi:hypothetical protein